MWGTVTQTAINANFASIFAASWDGKDEAQRSMPSGVYYVKLREGGVVKKCITKII